MGGQSTNPGDPCSPFGGFQNPLQFCDIQDFFNAVLSVIVAIGFPIVVLAIVYGGFLLVTARGNEEQLSKGKRALLWAIIGGLLVLGAQVLTHAIKGTVDPLLQTAVFSFFT